jgi:hypothetical protein
MTKAFAGKGRVVDLDEFQSPSFRHVLALIRKRSQALFRGHLQEREAVPIYREVLGVKTFGIFEKLAGGFVEPSATG